MYLSMALFCALLLFFSGMASVFETALTTVNRLKIKIMAEDGNKKAQKIMKLIDQYDLVITCIVIFDNLINIILPTVSLLFFISILHDENLAASFSTLIMSFLVIICGEIVPKIYGRIYAQQALFNLVYPLYFLVTIISPFAWCVNKITAFIKKYLFPKLNNDDDFDEEIITMINEEHQQGNLDQNQKNLITKAIMFNDKTVENIMQPKNKVIMVDADDNNASVYKTLINHRFSRIPVFHQDKNNIIGVLSEREFLSMYAKNRQFDKQLVISQPYFVPDSMKIANLLPQMQNDKIQMAIVIDEYGTMQGIISVEDMIEELVGEIWDEHDDVIKKIRTLRPSQYLVQSDVLISDLVDIVDIKSDEDMTIARYITQKLEKIAQVGDEINEDNYQLVVKGVEDNSITTILINVNKPEIKE